ncbi:NACHT-domain-containing protein [Penicillium robsamsonii]|uniref:NACHT-domain-containing protein n=1 Tax=Penicillium robsamsonii TaxID=1792511 RepID=UPI0025477AA4|nr:NACHT-domain-containing protein [Penicillium robsamsonii]KAJ5823607.1 NACHT-domain-containing protein [Penicillium robsamsonii]
MEAPKKKDERKGRWKPFWRKKLSRSGSPTPRRETSQSSANERVGNEDSNLPRSSLSIHAPATDNEQATEAPASTSLWDKAYDSLKEDEEKKKLLEAYEELAKGQISALPTSDTNGDPSPVTNQIPQHDVATREERLNKISTLGLEHVEDKKVTLTLLGHKVPLQQAVFNIGTAVQRTQNLVKDAIKDVPYAPIVIACVSLVLPLLTHPSEVETENSEGFAYVTSQMRYYAAMEDLRLPGEEKLEVKSDIEQRVIDLYKLIIDYQVQSILRFYRHPVREYFRSVVKWDPWEDMLESIKEAEQLLDSKLHAIMSKASLKVLENMSQEATKLREQLKSDLPKLISISQDSNIILRRIVERLSNDTNGRVLKDFTRRTSDPRFAKKRIESTKGGLLKPCYDWILRHEDFLHWRHIPENRLLWLRGDPGKGKTMLICGILNELIQSSVPTATVSFFFCEEAESVANNASAVLRGLIYLLVKQNPKLISHVEGYNLSDDRNSWFILVDILEKILQDLSQRTTYLIVDALDECKYDRKNLVELITNSAFPNVKWVVSSRNWGEFKDNLGASAKVELHLEENQEAVSQAVRDFIGIKMEELASKKGYSPEVQRYLSENSQDTFLWVALVCKRLAKPKYQSWNAEELLRQFPPGLEPLYERMIDRVRNSPNFRSCSGILAVVSIVHRPITLKELGVLAVLPSGLPRDCISALEFLVNQCGSFLGIQKGIVSFVHKSAKDYLVEHAAEDIYPSQVGEAHRSILLGSLKAMETLHQDIWGLQSPGVSIEDSKPPNPNPLAPLEYSSFHWIDHLHDCEENAMIEALQAEGPVDRFFRQKLLHWIEALTLLREVSTGVSSLLKLEASMKVAIKDLSGVPANLADRVRDACQFLRAHKPTIEEHPLQLYVSALIFSPIKSITRETFDTGKERPKWISKTPAMRDYWNECLLTLEVSRHLVAKTIAWSSDGSILAAAMSKEIKIWDATTGHCLEVYPSDYIVKPTAMAFHILNERLVVAVGSMKNAVRAVVLDLSRGQYGPLLESDSRLTIKSLVWSLDGTRVAGAAQDQTVKIWDASTGRLLSSHDLLYPTPLPGIEDIAELESEIKKWDPAIDQCIALLEGGSRDVSQVRPQDQIAIPGPGSVGFRLWDLRKAELQRVENKHQGYITLVSFSPSRSQLATGSHSGLIELWDPLTGQCSHTFSGHGGPVAGLSWAPDGTRLASTYSDHTLKIWNVGMQSSDLMADGYSGPVWQLALSPDKAKLASRSEHSIMVWNTTTGELIITHARRREDGRQGRLREVYWSPDSELVVTGVSRKHVIIWNAKTGEEFRLNDSGSLRVDEISWSPDSTKLVMNDYLLLHKVWIWNRASNQITSFDIPPEAKFVGWFPDSTRLMFRSPGDQGCKFTIGAWGSNANESVFENGSSWKPVFAGLLTLGRIRTTAWSHDGTRLAVVEVRGKASNELKIWNFSTGKWDVTVPDLETTSSIAWSQDDTRLALAMADSRPIEIYNTTTGRCVRIVGSRDIKFTQIEFDKQHPYYLHTRFGTFDTEPMRTEGSYNELEVSQMVGYGINIEETWIMYQGERVVKIPLDHRGLRSHRKQIFATVPGMCFFGCNSGHVLSFGDSRN